MEQILNRVPTDGTFELTVRCNLNCRMCLFRHADCQNSAIIAQEKSADEWIDMARQVAQAGTASLLITGGEPLLRNDFAEIWEGIYRIGFQIQLYTNATLVTPEIVALFRKYPPHKIGISIYGASENTYQKVCANGDAYRLTLEGIRQLSTLPSILDFKTTIIKDNLDDMNKMEEWVKDNYGSQHILVHTSMVFKPVRGGCSDAAACRLDSEDNVKLFFRRNLRRAEQILKSKQKDASKILVTVSKNTEKADIEPNDALFGCDAGMSSYTVSWDGALLGCQLIGECYTNPFDTGFQMAWDKFPQSVLPFTIDSKCLGCKSASYCFSCIATRYAETGCLGGCPEYFCRMTEQLENHINNYEKGYSNEKRISESNGQF